MHRVIPHYQRLQINKVIVAALLSGLPVVGYCADELPQVCAQVYGAAVDAVAAAISHDAKTIAAMRKVTAPRSEIARLKGADAELLRSLNDIVDEAFGALPVDRLTLYRCIARRICLRRLGGKKVPEDFKVTQPESSWSAARSREMKRFPVQWKWPVPAALIAAPNVRERLTPCRRLC